MSYAFPNRINQGIGKWGACEADSMASRSPTDSPNPGERVDRIARFECALCAETALATAIPYDALGYPICPTCGFHNRDY